MDIVPLYEVKREAWDQYKKKYPLPYTLGEGFSTGVFPEKIYYSQPPIDSLRAIWQFFSILDDIKVISLQPLYYISNHKVGWHTLYCEIELQVISRRITIKTGAIYLYPGYKGAESDVALYHEGATLLNQYYVSGETA